MTLIFGIWNIGTLKSGETRVLNIVVEVTKAGNISNFRFIDCDQDIIDINSSYDNVTVEVFGHKKNLLKMLAIMPPLKNL